MERNRPSLVKEFFRRVKGIRIAPEKDTCAPFNPGDVSDITTSHIQQKDGSVQETEYIKLVDGRLIVHDVTHHTYFR